jgi:hypothetical protein
MISAVEIKKNVITKLLDELYTNYLKMLSSIEFYRRDNVEVLVDDYDKKRKELAELKAERFDGSDEKNKERLIDVASKVAKLQKEIDYHDDLVKNIEKSIIAANEIRFHFNNILSYNDNEIYNKGLEEVK